MAAYLIVCAMSWLWTLAYFLLGASVHDPYYPLFSLTLMWIPGIFALAYAKKERMHLPVLPCRARYLFYAAAAAFFVGFCTLALSFPFIEAKSWKEMWHTFFSLSPLHFRLPLPGSFSAFVLIAVAGVIASAAYMIAAFGEELFWRGYLHEKWKGKGFFRSAGVIGALWGVWHWPIIAMGHNYLGTPWIGSLVMILFAVAASPLMAFFREKSESVLGAAVFHGALNMAATWGFVVFDNPNELFFDVEGLCGILVLCSLNLLLFKERRQLAKLTRPSL